MEVAIVNYNAGNTQSVINALNRIGVEPILTSDVESLRKADKVIFPGVGEASSTMNHLTEMGLDRILPDLTQPFLGVCLGMQLMCKSSEEGNAKCLGIFDIDVKKFIAWENEQIPHMGWNTLKDVQFPLFSKNMENEHAYFVHSYYVPENEYSVATTDYIHPFCSAIQKDNFYAVQFHPEKSAKTGQQILINFLSL